MKNDDALARVGTKGSAVASRTAATDTGAASTERQRLRPLFLIKPKSMSARDIRRAEKLAGFCIVECEDPEGARFLHPPMDAGIDAQAAAALSLMRAVLNDTSYNFTRAVLVEWFLKILMKDPPKAVPAVRAK